MLISKSPAPLQQFNISGTRSHNGQGPWRRQRSSRYLILSGSAVFDEQFTSHFGTTMTKDTIEGLSDLQGLNPFMVEEGSQYIKLPQFQIQPDISELPRVLEGILQSCADTLGGLSRFSIDSDSINLQLPETLVKVFISAESQAPHWGSAAARDMYDIFLSNLLRLLSMIDIPIAL